MISQDSIDQLLILHNPLVVITNLINWPESKVLPLAARKDAFKVNGNNYDLLVGLWKNKYLERGCYEIPVISLNGETEIVEAARNKYTENNHPRFFISLPSNGGLTFVDWPLINHKPEEWKLNLTKSEEQKPDYEHHYFTTDIGKLARQGMGGISLIKEASRIMNELSR